MASRNFKVYIANLGKYNEGELVGAWFDPPLNFEEVAEKIGLNEQYEEYAIHDTDDIPYSIIGEYCSLERINDIYEMMQDLPDYIVEDIEDFLCLFCDIDELYEKRDDIIYFETDKGLEGYAEYLIDEVQVLGEVPDALVPYIDYAAYARMLDTCGEIIETAHGVAEVVR